MARATRPQDILIIMRIIFKIDAPSSWLMTLETVVLKQPLSLLSVEWA